MRSSGKTYRAVLRAVADASEGRRIVYVSSTLAHLDIAINYASILTQIIEGVIRSKTKVNFIHSNGVIFFVTLSEYEHSFFDYKLEGIKFDCVVEDLS